MFRSHTAFTKGMIKRTVWEAQWPSGRALDSRARGRGFDPHSGRRVVSLRKIHLPPEKYWYKYPGNGGSSRHD